MLLSAAAGLVLSLAYVGPSWPELALFAPAALLFFAAQATVSRAALSGAAFGAAFSAVALAWVGAVTWLGWAALVAAFAASFAALGAAVSLATARGLVVRLVAPPTLLALELVRARVFTGFPWLFLGHALSDRLALVQIADLGGAYAVSYVAALWCSGLADAARESLQARAIGRSMVRAAAGAMAPALVALCATAAYGAARLALVRTDEGPRLLLVQGNIDTPRAAASAQAAEEVDLEIWRVHEELSRAHASGAELVVWSESMLPGYYNDPADPDAELWRRKLAALLGELGRPLLAGSNATGPHPLVRASGPPRPGRLDYNSAFLVAPDGSILGRYDKMHLVPFGEYVPLARWPLFARLTPYAAEDPGYAHGDPGQPLMEFAGRRFGVLICYEDAFAELAARAARMGAEFLVNLSSEAWFAGTAEIPQHFRISRFRAVEMRMPLVRCCNVGVTAVIDPAGRVTGRLEGGDSPGGARGALLAVVPLAAGARSLTPYARLGDLAPLALVGAHAVAAAAVISSRKRRARGVGAPGACG